MAYHVHWHFQLFTMARKYWNYGPKSIHNINVVFLHVHLLWAIWQCHSPAPAAGIRKLKTLCSLLSFPLDKGTSKPPHKLLEWSRIEMYVRTIKNLWCGKQDMTGCCTGAGMLNWVEKNSLTSSWATVPNIPGVSNISLGFLERFYQLGWEKRNVPTTALLHLSANHFPSKSHQSLIQKVQ